MSGMPQSTPSVVPPVPPTFKVETKILSSKYVNEYLKVIVTPYKGRYKICFAAALFVSTSRKEISFNKVIPFSVDEVFDKHVYQSLRQVVSRSKGDLDQELQTE